MSEILSTEAVSVQFQGLKALDNVSLRLRRGEILGLLGPNGAGKTTLVNVLSGFQPPTQGHVQLDGQPLRPSGPEFFARSGIARTFQSVRLFPRLSVLENVQVAALLHHSGRAQSIRKAREAIAFVGLSHVEGRPSAELPYAQERLIGIARALALEPDFLLLDEPAAGMQDVESGKLIELIRAIPGTFNCGILLIEHNLQVIMECCPSLHVLQEGRTLTNGTQDDVRRDPLVIEAYLGVS
ncbi:ABC transporter ATP-binding protein [Pseudochelatococcus sp. B33]